jgi:hypothetical protein
MIFDLEVLKKVLFIVPLVLFIHEMEEWNIYAYHKRSYKNVVAEETILGGRLWLIFLSLGGLAWTVICFFIPNLVASIVLMMLLIDFTILNSIQHIGMSMKTKQYNPGLIFGGIVAMIVAVIVIRNILFYRVIPTWCMILLLCLIIPPLIETINSSKKNKLPKMVEWILQFSSKLERFLSE